MFCILKDSKQAGKHVLCVKNLVILGNAVSFCRFSCPLSHQET